jgi:hypothetical protein
MAVANGAETQTLNLLQLPTGITSSNPSQAISVTSTASGIPSGMDNGSFLAYNGASYGYYSPGRNGIGGPVPLGAITSTGISSIGVTSNNTSGNAHPIVPPTLIAECVVRVIP